MSAMREGVAGSGAAAGSAVAFGRYELLRRLGSGGMAEIFLARPIDPAHRLERYALKRLLPELAALPDFKELFEQEMRLASKLQHRNLLTVHDCGEVDGRYFIASEYVEGLDCWKISRRLSRSGGVLPLSLIVQIACGTLEGLDYIHSLKDEAGRTLGVVHRDVSPSNILISLQGEVKLSDFGVALVPNEELESQRRKRLRGKIRFLSPEQLEGKRLDARSDLFAIGVLMAEMILGRSPFHGSTDLAVLLNIRDVRLNLADDFEKHVPADLRATLLRSLAREPRDRHANAAAMRQEVLEFARRAGLKLDPAELADAIRRLLRPGDTGDEDVYRSTLTPEENDPVAPRDPLDRYLKATPVEPTAEYRVRKADGREFGPFPYSALVEGVVAGEYVSLDLVSADGGAFLPLTSVPGIRQHLPLLEQTTTGVIIPSTPDKKGRFEIDTVAGVFIAMAAQHETGLLVADLNAIRKEIYFVDGNPLYVSSNIQSEQLGRFLHARGVITSIELDMALAVLPRYQGNIGDALIALEVVDPVTLFEHITEHIRHRLLDIYTWKRGAWWFYRGVTCQRDFTLLPAAPSLIREGVDRSLPDHELEEWWTATAAIDLAPASKASPPRAWWELDELDTSVLAVVDRRMSGAEALGRLGQRLPEGPREKLLRAFHFCLTAGLLRLAFN
jgi:serine/threonine protein kinase